MGNTFYDFAVYGDVERVKEWLERDPAVVNSRDQYGFTALHGVAGEDQEEMARLLISYRADVNVSNDEGMTPLHLAAYPWMAEILISSGAKIDARSKDGDTPLMVQAAEQESLDVMESLLEHGADVNLKNKFGLTALDIARSREEEGKIELLSQYGAK